MARKIECERCGKQADLRFRDGWSIVDLTIENHGADVPTTDLCTACTTELSRWLTTVEPPKLTTSEFCDAERHVFSALANSNTCACGQWTAEGWKMRVLPEDLSDDDVPF